MIGKVTNVTLFVGPVGGIFQCLSNSPCINAGLNAAAPAGPDLDGNSRITGGTIDIGAYEFPTPSSMISYAWLQQYGLPTDGSADFSDPDGDHMSNWAEWMARTIPTNNASALRMLDISGVAPNVTIRWPSVASRTYFVQRAADVTAQSNFQTLASDI